ncbi:MAG TPA: hypothetical protein VFZ21_02220 [Gemmatimonadaceae bacterium]|nr:hypothetical protein [Gemmatimonadaceae bacterium]
MASDSLSHSMARSVYLLTVSLLLSVTACVPPGATSSAASLGPATLHPMSRGEMTATPHGVTCDGDCGAVPLSPDLARAIESRIADLEARGGVCSQYGAVLDRSYRSGRITIRPYMWRVGKHLTSGEAKPSGEMTLAREIDPLNVGVRTVDDVVRTMEHEAVHITFDLRDGLEGGEDDANRYVRACRSEPARAG